MRCAALSKLDGRDLARPVGLGEEALGLQEVGGGGGGGETGGAADVDDELAGGGGGEEVAAGGLEGAGDQVECLLGVLALGWGGGCWGWGGGGCGGDDGGGGGDLGGGGSWLGCGGGASASALIVVGAGDADSAVGLRHGCGEGAGEGCGQDEDAGEMHFDWLGGLVWCVCVERLKDWLVGCGVVVIVSVVVL